MAKKAKAKAVEEATPLIGKALLQKLKEIPHLSRREKARECGYYMVLKDDQIRVSSGEFMNAVLSAKGISLETETLKKGQGKEASYRVRLHSNGQILIGTSYTQQMGLLPGDEFEIKLGYKHIHLVQVGAEAGEE